MVREGTILDSGEILYLKATWINELLREILNHDLANVKKEDFWAKKLVKFCGSNNKMFCELKWIHDNFPSTGILNVRYLRFLWRDVSEISDMALFESLLRTMSSYGLIFRGNPIRTVNERAGNSFSDSTELFVPLHLPSTLLENDLEELPTLLKHQFRKELVFEILQPYVPPGVLGMLMARFLLWEDVEFRKCWGRGVVFILGEALVLLFINTPSGEKKAHITINLFGERFVSALSATTRTIKQEIESMFFEHFSGVKISVKKGYPRDVGGISTIDGGYTPGGRNVTESMGAVDIVNAVVERIDGLEAHLDRELSLLLQGLHQLEDKLDHVAKLCNTTLARLNRLQSSDVGCPSLVIIRPAAAMVSGGQSRSLWAMLKDLSRRGKKLVCKDMRLCFLCPYDFSEVPCGLGGNGYPLTTTREWVKKIRPVLKVKVGYPGLTSR